MRIYLSPGFDESLAPVPATKMRGWWEDNNRTRNHAKHCLPLVMANSLGYYILSPGTFLVRWDGNVHAPAQLEVIDQCSHFEVDTHAAFGSFVVQPSFIPVTDRVGDFVYVKGIANERGLAYSCMEAAIEAWWNVGKFGLVFLLNQPGEIMINKGQPIAQFFVLAGGSAVPELDYYAGWPPGHAEWQAKRGRPGYRKDLDYLNGRRADGSQVDTHITSWKKASRYGIPGEPDAQEMD